MCYYQELLFCKQRKISQISSDAPPACLTIDRCGRSVLVNAKTGRRFDWSRIGIGDFFWREICNLSMTHTSKFAVIN